MVTLVPDAVEHKEKLDEDASEWEDPSHERAWNRVREPVLDRNLPRDLVGTHRWFRWLQEEGMPLVITQ